MSGNEYGKVIAKNLKRIAYEHKKTQADIARDLHLNQGTVSTWMVGSRIPRMDKIDLLCNYFNVSRAEIMEEAPTSFAERISENERELLHLFRSLSPVGKSAALNTLRGFQSVPEYQKKDEQQSSSSIA